MEVCSNIVTPEEDDYGESLSDREKIEAMCHAEQYGEGNGGKCESGMTTDIRPNTGVITKHGLEWYAGSGSQATFFENHPLLQNARGSQSYVNSRVMPIACDINSKSGGKFWGAVSDSQTLFRKIKSLDPLSRCLYEMIPVYRPCVCYFDVEFLDNDIIRGVQRFDRIVEFTTDVLRATFCPNGVNPEVIIGTSSRQTPKGYKHSYQIRVPNIVFGYNTVPGALKLFHETLQGVVMRHAADPRVDFMLDTLQKRKHGVQDEVGDTTCSFVLDPSVYTKNRCMRLPFCLKATEDRSLTGGKWLRLDRTKASGHKVGPTEEDEFHALLVGAKHGYDPFHGKIQNVIHVPDEDFLLRVPALGIEEMVKGALTPCKDMQNKVKKQEMRQGGTRAKRQRRGSQQVGNDPSFPPNTTEVLTSSRFKVPFNANPSNTKKVIFCFCVYGLCFMSERVV